MMKRDCGEQKSGYYGTATLNSCPINQFHTSSIGLMTWLLNVLKVASNYQSHVKRVPRNWQTELSR